MIPLLFALFAPHAGAASGNHAQPSLPDSALFHFGEIVGLCGDLDGDRCSEFAIAGRGSEDILVFGGKDGRLFRRVGPTKANEYLSGGFARTSDLDRDGVHDMAIAFVGHEPRSSWVEIRSGKSGATLRTLAALKNEEQLGAGLTEIGDVDGDGIGELVLSAFHPSSDGRWAGMCWIVISAANGHRCQTIDWHGASFSGWTASRENPAATRLGDVNGDGIPDFAVIDDLLVRVQSGAKAEVIHEFPLPRQPAKRGARYSVCGEIDFDCDGRSDIVIGSPYAGRDDRSTPKQFVRIFSGRTGELLRVITRDGDRAGFGYGIVPAQISKTTGVPDLWVAQHNPFGYGLFLLSADGNEREISSGSLDHFTYGWQLAGGADVDGDGVSDIILGCYSPFSAGVDFNGAHVYSGRDGRQLHEITRDSDREAIRPK